MEVWIINLAQGTENKIYESKQARNVLGWTKDDHLLIREFNTDGSGYTIKELSLKSEAGLSLLHNVDILDLSSDGGKILYSPQRPSSEIWTFDIANQEKQQVLSLEDGIQFDPTATFSPKGDRVVALDYTGNTGERTVRVIDLKSGEMSNFKAADNVIYTSTAEWIINNLLLVNGRQSGNSKAWTISLNPGGDSDE
ncbi:hypothetical protein [Paenibacillus sp. LHD-38]|uniref:hypothetical protein n=1 Tax=Paenibacillus sp. LHD-38 TaxID=3072143 RepID=UPI00280E7E6F|nr:hypothetical protein [Paenibacillus sp. LHD-38]MDQ8737149.1 hypothetical protein [Paenibacillus sp. LHD-38]